ncbi:MAG: hypothetical protein DRJ14_05820 [Acidobacteria bacterium]|nr:MAG: hypothetical protein DRJ14_05820 [Acidobacteriota bacterium]
MFGFWGGWNPHCRFQRQHGTFPEAPLMSKLNGTPQGKFLFQKQVFEMRVPLGKLTVVGISPPLEMREQNGDWQRRGACPPLCGHGQLSARYAWAAEVEVGVIIVKVRVRVRERRELANHCLLTFLILSFNTQHLSLNIRRNAPRE